MVTVQSCSQKEGVMYTENVGHLVFEVLRSNQWIEQLLPTLDHGVNLTTSATEVGIVVEGLPQVVDRLMPRLCSGIDENTDFRLIRG